jgi:TldD protein
MGTLQGIRAGGGGTLYPVRQPVSAAPAADKVALVRRAEAAARGVDPRIERVEVYFNDEQKEVAIATSDGRFVVDQQPMLIMNVRAIAADGQKRQAGGQGGGGRIGLEYFDSTTPEDLGKEAAKIAIAMLDARPAPAGEMEVILAAGDSGILLHEAVGHGLEADFNRKKTSNYSDQVGQPVASPLCTVVDDGTVQGSRGSINVDDEGNLPQRNVLIEGGILRGYMHDRISTGHFSVGASGNGRRESFRHTPLPRMTNTYMLNGPHSKDEILSATKKGIYAKSFGGGQVNISNGDFVFNVTEGYLVEDGRITAPLKGVTLIGNGPDALRKVSMVGNDFQMSDGRWTCGKDGQSVPVGVGMPTVKIAGITVGGTEVG